MSGESQTLSGPDLAQGVAADDLAEGEPLLGHAHGEAVVLVRHGEEVFAIGAQCTHYGGPLAEGLVVGDTVRCPWHHACFSLRTGEAVKAPALNPIACYQVVRDGDLVRVGDKLFGVLYNTAPMVLAPVAVLLLCAAMGWVAGPGVAYVAVAFLVLVTFAVVLGSSR